MQYVDHHGTHHRFAKIPYYNLPQTTPLVYEHETGPMFRSYFAAFLDMVKSLPDPKAGSQWRQHDARVAAATMHLNQVQHDSPGVRMGGASS
jgi:fatty acid desaturase